jgi:uncharacterized protein (DUF2062 family)
VRGPVDEFIHRRFISPFLLREVPPEHLSRGAGIGLFVALLPVVGQLYWTPAVWALLRVLPRLRFNQPVAMAMVAVITPPVKVPLFYGYIVTGDRLLDTFGFAHMTDSTAFRAGIAAMADASWREWLDHTSRLIGLALERYALPLAVGGVAWAVVAGAGAGLGTAWILTRRARRGEKGERSKFPAPS